MYITNNKGLSWADIARARWLGASQFSHMGRCCFSQNKSQLAGKELIDMKCYLMKTPKPVIKASFFKFSIYHPQGKFSRRQIDAFCCSIVVFFCFFVVVFFFFCFLRGGGLFCFFVVFCFVLFFVCLFVCLEKGLCH